MVIVVEQLYPSLDAERVAKMVYEAVLVADIKWESIDFLEAVRYIAINWSAEKCSRSDLRRILPVRRGRRGTRPTVRGVGPKGPERGDCEQWIFRKVTLTKLEKKKVVATVAQIAVETMFSTHMYSFGVRITGKPKGVLLVCEVHVLLQGSSCQCGTKCG